MTGQTTVKLEYCMMPRGLLICRARSHGPVIVATGSGGQDPLHDEDKGPDLDHDYGSLMGFRV